MTKKSLPTPAHLRQLLRYDADTGRLFWRDRTPDMFADGKVSAAQRCLNFQATYAGREAFTASNANGYKIGRIHGVGCLAHRVAWAIRTGFWPEKHIDHINGQPFDNRINNLREATVSQNLCNQKRSRCNTSGVKGVAWCKQTKKWQVHGRIKGRQTKIGRFDTLEAAAQAYADFSAEHYGDFANLG